MPRPHPQLWKEISPYLDHALTLSAEQQRAWLASLRKENNDLAAHLEEFLAEHRVLDQQGFLEDSPMRGSSELELAGHSIGRYRLVSPIGRGGMSTVWLAERSDGRFERRVAIKFLGIALIGHGEERFRREGSLLGRLSHPNIAELLDAGLSAGSPYLVLEYIEGEPIDEYSNSGRLGVEARIRLFLNVLAAVAHAHANLVIHRDIKPSNVFVRKKDSEVKLLDFGIAKLLEVNQESGSGSLTVTRESGLTPAYAAPEQLNQGQITTTTDVYGLGVLLYLLLCGRHPAGPGPHSTIELVKAITEKEPERMSDAVTAESASQRSTTVDKLRRTLRGDLDTIVAKALKKDPRERYDSATAFAHDLNRYLQRKPIRARADTIAYRTAKFIRRNRIPVALGAISILTFIAGLIGTLIQAHTARTQRDFAFRQLARAEQLNQLTSFLLTDAAPSNAPITVNHLLGRAELIVNKEDYRNHPADHVELLISIGEQYLARGDTEQSKRILQQAYELSRKLEERAVRAQAACELAVPIDESGLHRQAEALIAEGLRDLPNDSAAVLDRVSCLTEASEVAVGGGLAKEAVSRSLAALAALDRSPVQSDNLRLTVLSDLAQAYNASGQSAQAVDVYQQAAAVLDKLGYDQTRSAVDLLAAWAFALGMAGKPVEAERIFRRALDLTRAKDLEDAATPGLLLNYSNILYDLAHLEEAEPYGERALEKAKSTGDQVVVEQSMMNLGRIYRGEHKFDRSQAMLDQVEPLLRRDLPAGHYAFAKLANERSLLAANRGDYQAALRLNEEAVRIMEAAVKGGRQGWVASLLVDRSKIELTLHQPQKAYQDLERAFSMPEVQSLPLCATRGAFFLARARVLEALSRSDEAQAAARSALEDFEQTVGPDHPDLLEARAIAGVQQHP